MLITAVGKVKMEMEIFAPQIFPTFISIRGLRLNC